MSVTLHFSKSTAEGVNTPGNLFLYVLRLNMFNFILKKTFRIEILKDDFKTPEV